MPQKQTRSAKPEFTDGDLRVLLDAEFDARQMKKGEITAKLYAAEKGCTEVEAKNMLEYLYTKGKADKRHAGRVAFYFPKA
jgi:hypothetical protein